MYKKEWGNVNGNEEDGGKEKKIREEGGGVLNNIKGHISINNIEREWDERRSASVLEGERNS